MGITYRQFGQHLLESYDLDPLYAILAEVSWDDSMLKRFLLAYTVFYSAGVAAFASEVGKTPDKFYRLLRQGEAEKWPRGHERRHLRAQQFEDCIHGLEMFGSPEKIIDVMTIGKDWPTVSHNVQSFRGYGPWMAFKIFDLADRVLGHQVDLTGVDLCMYRDPVKGAALWRFKDQDAKITPVEIKDTVVSLKHLFSDYKAPPFDDRPLTVMEIETILCKAKSNFNGHYPLGNDTVEIWEGLKGWGDAAQELRGLIEPYYRYWSKWDEADRKVRIEL